MMLAVKPAGMITAATIWSVSTALRAAATSVSTRAASRSLRSAERSNCSKASPNWPPSWLTTTTGSLVMLLPLLLNAPVIMPMPSVSAKGAASIKISAARSRNISFRSFQPMVSSLVMVMAPQVKW